MSDCHLFFQGKVYFYNNKISENRIKFPQCQYDPYDNSLLATANQDQVNSILQKRHQILIKHSTGLVAIQDNTFQGNDAVDGVVNVQVGISEMLLVKGNEFLENRAFAGTSALSIVKNYENEINQAIYNFTTEE